MIAASTLEQLRDSTLRSLEASGYSRLQTPVVIGGIALDLGLALRGPSDSLSLVVVVERPPTREDALRAYWQIQRLARALDAVGSCRTITVILLGGTGEGLLMNELQEIGRVLTVDDTLPVDRLLAPLLRLSVPAPSEVALDGLAEVRSAAKGQHARALLNLIAAAGDGDGAVEARYAAWINDAFASSSPGRGSSE